MADAAPTRDQLLTATLGELVEYWLEVRCSGCTSVVYVPLRHLASKLGRRQQLQDIIKRLRCQHAELRREFFVRPTIQSTTSATAAVIRLGASTS
jgi:hypothetical protein